MKAFLAAVAAMFIIAIAADLYLKSLDFSTADVYRGRGALPPVSESSD